jgi:molybdenum transport protein
LQESLLAPLVAVAGGVNARNAADYARAGADILVTSAPYWAPPSDVRVTFLR